MLVSIGRDTRLLKASDPVRSWSIVKKYSKRHNLEIIAVWTSKGELWYQDFLFIYFCENMDGYSLSRQWFDFSFENPDIVWPTHTALYMWAIEQWNRFWQKEKFWLPAEYSMQAIWIKSKNTYYKAYNDLVDLWFFKVIEKSKNQNSANIISLYAVSKNKSAGKSALDIALIQQVSQHEYSTWVGKWTIDKQVNKETKKQIENENIIKKEIEKYEIWTTRYIFFSTLLENKDLLVYQLDEKSIEAIVNKLWEFREKVWEVKTRIELESFWEHHKSEKTQIKSLILRLNTWLSISLSKK